MAGLILPRISDATAAPSLAPDADRVPLPAPARGLLQGGNVEALSNEDLLGKRPTMALVPGCAGDLLEPFLDSVHGD